MPFDIERLGHGAFRAEFLPRGDSANSRGSLHPLASVQIVEEIGLRRSASEPAWPEPAMNRFVLRIIMTVLLVAALAIIWNVLGGR